MEAKDTVMSDKGIYSEYESWLDREEDEYQIKGLREVAKRQAEISFKAGIKEVVEWIHHTFNKAITLDQMSATTTWQSKLEEWGIDK